MIIAYVCDEHYLPYLTASMNSVRRYNPQAKFVVLSDHQFEVPGAEVYSFEPPRNLFKFKANDRMHDGVYYKFWLPSLPYNNIIYMDCDIICQRPLNELWEMPCEFMMATQSHEFGKKQAESLRLPKYMLTGMMSMNLQALRDIHFTEKCLDLLSHSLPDQHDETIINLLFNGLFDELPVKWNYCRNRIYGERKINEEDAYLLHYVGNQKKDMLKYTDFAILNNIKPMLRNRSVAIVGNSESLIKKGSLGGEIDCHDVVIRFNKGFPGAKTGYKTDLLFLACTLTQEELKLFNGAITVKRSGLCENQCDLTINPADRDMLKQEGTLAVNRHGEIKCQPSTGFLAINFALSCQPKRIDLYGFDFFKTPTYYNQPDYQTLHNGEKEREKVLEYEKWGLLKIR